MEIENNNDQESFNIAIEPQIRYACALLKLIGKNATQIVQILNEFDNVEISERSIYRFIKQWKEDQRIEPKFHQNGNQIYSEENKQMLVESFQQDPKMSVYQAQISDQVNPNQMSYETIIQTLHNNGLKAYTIPKIINIRQANKDYRLKLCKSKSRWIQRWQDVLFSDECLIFAELSGKKYAWLENKNQITNKMCKEKVQYPLKVMVWAIISYQQGPVYIKWVEGSMNSSTYTQILDDFLLENQKIFDEKTLFQQDNAKPHSCSNTKEWFDKKNIELLEWPSQSPDLSPIENIWPILKEEVWLLRDKIKSKEDLYSVVKTCFFNSNDIKKTISNAYNSLSSRIKRVIQQEGDFLRD